MSEFRGGIYGVNSLIQKGYKAIQVILIYFISLFIFYSRHLNPTVEQPQLGPATRLLTEAAVK